MLGSEIKLERPGEHMPPRLRRKLPSIKISKILLRGEIRDQKATYSTGARVIFTAAAVMELRMHCQRSYVQHPQQQLRELCIRM